MSLEFRYTQEISYGIIFKNNSSQDVLEKALAKTKRVLNNLVTYNNGICCVFITKWMAILYDSFKISLMKFMMIYLQINVYWE